MPDNRIRELREAQGLSGKELAVRAGTSVQQIYRLEMGERRLTLEWVRKLAAALKVNEYELLAETRPEKEHAALVIGLLRHADEITRLPRPRRIAGPVDAFAFSALEVPENTLQTQYNPGDVLFIKQTAPTALAAAVGKECVIKTEEGRLLLKVVVQVVQSGLVRACTPGTYALTEYAVKWASPVLWVKKAVTGTPLKEFSPPA